MCIRDRVGIIARVAGFIAEHRGWILESSYHSDNDDQRYFCLLYTSDAADERSSVDLGGRRIIKKKNTVHTSGQRLDDYVHKQQAIDKRWQQPSKRKGAVEQC